MKIYLRPVFIVFFVFVLSSVRAQIPINVTFLAVPLSGCKPFNVNFLFTTTPDVQDSSWIWDFGDILSLNNTSTLEDPSHIYTEEGNYIVTLTVTDTDGYIHSGTLLVNVYTNPSADFYWLPEVVTMANPTLNFIDISAGADHWYWNFGDQGSGNDNQSDIASPSHEFSDSGSFNILLIVQSSHGCADTIRKNVTIYPELLLFIPNAFTPDNNGLNDVWKPVISGISSDGYSLDIFDRWGERVFITFDSQQGWDGRVNGKVAPVGEYFWLLHYLNALGKEYKRRGHVTLIR